MEVLMGGSSSGGSDSTVISKEEVVEQENPMVGIEGTDDSELELGLGLSLGFLGSKDHKQIPRILTAKDLPSLGFNSLVSSSPSSASSFSSLGLKTPSSINSIKNNNVKDNTNNTNNNNNANSVVGNKRAASPTGASQVVGWPPIRAYRMNSMANQAKSIATAEHSLQFDETKLNDVVYGADAKGHTTTKERLPLKNSLFVKVNMDGVAIGRKVDINAHSGYESLAWALEEMFVNRAAEQSSGNELMLMPKVIRPSKLLDGSSDYVLTYEDKDGDWMLVGDVPWGMFINSVKRLRIMRTSEAKGLSPRLEQRSAKHGSRPI